jgi:bla regulator protein BlaR1
MDRRGTARTEEPASSSNVGTEVFVRVHILRAAGIIAVAAALVAGTLGAVSVRAQGAQGTAAAAGPEFEAASIKPNKGVGPFGIGFQPGGRFNATNVTLRMLISAAYGTPQPLPPFQVLGGPAWLDTDRFDVMAKAAGNPMPGPAGPPPEMFLMIQKLLADRFHLAVHRETQELPVYALVMSRPDGKLGGHLRITATDCAAIMSAARNGAPPAPPGPDSPFCGIRGGLGRFIGSSATMAIISNVLSRQVNRVVLDRTGLAGSYDFELEWTPEQMPTGPGNNDEQRPGALPPPPADGPSLFTALQEQLGVKLDSTKGPVNVLAVDRAEPPSAD